ncbi:MAG: hypothetical protein K9I68_03110 [Bacteroidales bacterium]|nr:hypothetical protein [Bacteroidales bacterium]MCF8336846.1 hypothetical protein [Bacteroidales bacterium]
MRIFKLFLTGLLLFVFSLPVLPQSVQRVSVQMKSQVLKEGKKYTQKADCYYSPAKGIYVTHYYQPKEFIKKTNRKGEMMIYFPEENEVSIKQDFYFSSENELLHYFINNLTEDLGLRKEGFKRVNTEYEGEHMVTIWEPPAKMELITKVELVFKDMMPVFSAYINSDRDTLRKIYYSDYYESTEFMLPTRVTEISYREQDSIVKRTIYSDIKVNDKVTPYYLNYEIPDDAKRMEDSY